MTQLTFLIPIALLMGAAGLAAFFKGFYESHGFKKVSEEYDEDGIPHIEMLRSAH